MDAGAGRIEMRIKVHLGEKDGFPAFTGYVKTEHPLQACDSYARQGDAGSRLALLYVVAQILLSRHINITARLLKIGHTLKEICYFKLLTASTTCPTVIPYFSNR
jgi:hypothetical protein